jgi:hypothetical protein
VGGGGWVGADWQGNYTASICLCEGDFPSCLGVGRAQCGSCEMGRRNGVELDLGTNRREGTRWTVQPRVPERQRENLYSPRRRHRSSATKALV